MASAVLKRMAMLKSMARNHCKLRAFALVAVGTDMVSAAPDVSLQKARSWDKVVSSKFSTTALKDILKDKKVVIFGLPKSSGRFARNTEISQQILVEKEIGDPANATESKEFDNLCKDKKLKEALGNFACVAALPGMKNREGHGSASIAIMSSQAGQVGIYGYTAYSASKFGLKGMAEALYQEIIANNIHVSLIFPPDTETPGFVEENKRRPQLTGIIAASSGAMKVVEVSQESIERHKKW